MNRKRRAMLIMVVTAIMWSIGGIFIKLISWNPFLIAGVRSVISGSIMAVYMAKSHVSFKLNRYSFLAGIGLGFSATLFTIANKLTTAANAIVLQYTAPIFILILLAVFFHQKMVKREVVVVLITMIIACTIVNITAVSDNCEMLETQKALEFKLNNADIRDEFGLLNKSFVDDVETYNKKLISHKSLSENPWASAFYPKKVIEGCERIDYEKFVKK